MNRLEGKIAIITGGAAGIGRETVKRFVSEGARVVIADIQERAGEEVAAEIGSSARYEKLDVSHEESWAQVVAKTAEEWGGLDVLVNNAGISSAAGPQDPETVSVEEWRAVQRVNVEGIILGCKYALPIMKHARSASIVNISSIAALIGTPNLAAYGASKAAVYQYTKTVALHCARNRYPIRCNSVHPGIVRTEILDKVFSPEEQEVRRKAIPIGEFGEPGDVADAVIFLASDESKHVTGTKLMVTGGIGISML